MGLILKRYISPLGPITLAAEDGLLIGLWFDGQMHFAEGSELSAAESGDCAILTEAALWLDSYFAGKRPDPRLLCMRFGGSPFMNSVWQELMNIPYGERIAYGELAARVGCNSPRAVGAAVGRNPISIVVPCHRVIGANGSLVGYAGGIERKKWLLEHEQS